jgi:putative SOS response-associated peptidase YedK
MDSQSAEGHTHWFALDESRPPFALAGILRPWTGERKGETREHRLFQFLTIEANDLVRPIHANAMPVLLAIPDEWDIWMSGPLDEALKLQRPLPDHELQIVAMGANRRRWKLGMHSQSRFIGNRY